jgi:hypothetical protein
VLYGYKPCKRNETIRFAGRRAILLFSGRGAAVRIGRRLSRDHGQAFGRGHPPKSTGDRDRRLGARAESRPLSFGRPSNRRRRPEWSASRIVNTAFPHSPRVRFPE